MITVVRSIGFMRTVSFQPSPLASGRWAAPVNRPFLLTNRAASNGWRESTCTLKATGKKRGGQSGRLLGSGSRALLDSDLRFRGIPQLWDFVPGGNQDAPVKILATLIEEELEVTVQGDGVSD